MCDHGQATEAEEVRAQTPKTPEAARPQAQESRRPAETRSALPKARAAQVLVPRTHPCFLIPSPDKSFVCCFCVTADNGEDRRLLVIHEDGKVAADLQPPPKVKSLK